MTMATRLFLTQATCTVSVTRHIRCFFVCISKHMKMMFLSIQNRTHSYVAAYEVPRAKLSEGFHSNKEVVKHCRCRQLLNSLFWTEWNPHGITSCNQHHNQTVIYSQTLL